MNFKVLLEKPKDKTLLLTFLLSLILTFVFAFIMLVLLAQFPEGAGLWDMKDAWNKENMDRIINKWKGGSFSYYIELMMIVHILDFVFMVLYGIAIFSGLLIVARRLKDSEKLQNFYFVMALISWFATLFDVLEGVFILIILFDPYHITDFTSFGVSFFSLLCSIVFRTSLFLLVIGLIIVLIQHIRNKK